jgi:hypothetical protein
MQLKPDYENIEKVYIHALDQIAKSHVDNCDIKLQMKYEFKDMNRNELFTDLIYEGKMNTYEDMKKWVLDRWNYIREYCKWANNGYIEVE